MMAYRDLERNLIIVCHEKEEKDESDGILKIRPAVTPKLGDTLMGLMDIVGHLTLEIDKEGNQTRYLQVSPSRRVSAKTRIGGLASVITNPTMDMFITEKES